MQTFLWMVSYDSPSFSSHATIATLLIFRADFVNSRARLLGRRDKPFIGLGNIFFISTVDIYILHGS